jgi:predicted RNA binding protein YcfA (HicA-like mRNA interferase family)
MRGPIGRGMSRLPSISGKECVAALAKAGFSFRRQTGNHMVLRRDRRFAQAIVPNHDECDRGTLRAIIRQADLGVGEFLGLL